MDELILSGLTVTAIGLGVVFILLTMLVGIIQAMSALAAAIGGAPAIPAAAATPPALPAPADAERIAVISAAVSAYQLRRRGT